jgi:hypothetical protein
MRTAMTMNRINRMIPSKAGHASEMKLVSVEVMLVTVTVKALVMSGVAIGVTTLVSSRSNACGAKPISVEVNTRVRLSIVGWTQDFSRSETKA